MTSPHHFPSGCFPLYNGTKAQAGETISCVLELLQAIRGLLVVEMIECGLGKVLANVVGMDLCPFPSWGTIYPVSSHGRPGLAVMGCQ